MLQQRERQRSKLIFGQTADTYKDQFKIQTITQSSLNKTRPGPSKTLKPEEIKNKPLA